MKHSTSLGRASLTFPRLQLPILSSFPPSRRPSCYLQNAGQESHSYLTVFASRVAPCSARPPMHQSRGRKRTVSYSLVNETSIPDLLLSLVN
ncbi:hypothetical protein HBI56_102230 [Parastagonospora nodorum]|uniref:Uncharacterized protein n=1 Tax=Phaeosphaeria nodorum (strain SN15 / ATCC MYA-4574 / FGSC 10173) TaxID=321614 RepID=A0A7U2I2G7_PHANO|nr:hypothetical protein HBH56_031180 [Parastagonospora nodorum]QRC99343.1 hypothetical protein JI435_413290 [Parastagonospora nodorum SN15]KAH3934326.1 hypothetical protein HBH54_050830 [Parastagonospora nodorum]KAH3943075.1 hypothetical protein HBH53_179840 [Parastagonospora nodorum]KAH3956635.1 hypothetical protein HBH51_238180 [Parastagonospora nodorum]